MATNSSHRVSSVDQVTPSNDPLPRGVPGSISVLVAGLVSLQFADGTTTTRDLGVGDYGYRPLKVLPATVATVEVNY